MHRLRAVTSCLALFLAPAASADFIIGDGAGSSPSSPTFVFMPGNEIDTLSIVGELTGPSGDVDFFNLILLETDLITIRLEGVGEVPPELTIGILSPNAEDGIDEGDVLSVSPIESSDGSVSVTFHAIDSGFYGFAITGLGDTDFDGLIDGSPHTEFGPYTVAIEIERSSIPGPASLGVVGTGAYFFARRRRKP